MVAQLFILASRSPQRKEILERLGVSFEVIPSDFDEMSVRENDPVKRAMVLAEIKAEDVASKFPDRWVIGVDTLVVASDGSLLEKPVDADDARRMLRLHSGNTSTIHTALCLMRSTEKHAAIDSAQVTFRTLTSHDIEWWIATRLWMERSGAFQIEGDGGKLVEKLEGEKETVVGFPVQVFLELLRKIGITGV